MPAALLPAASAPLGTPDPPSDHPLAPAGWTRADSRMEEQQSQLRADLRGQPQPSQLTGLPRSRGEVTGSATSDPCSVQRMFLRETKRNLLIDLKGRHLFHLEPRTEKKKNLTKEAGADQPGAWPAPSSWPLMHSTPPRAREHPPLRTRGLKPRGTTQLGSCRGQTGIGLSGPQQTTSLITSSAPSRQTRGQRTPEEGCLGRQRPPPRAPCQGSGTHRLDMTREVASPAISLPQGMWGPRYWTLSPHSGSYSPSRGPR